MSENGVNNLIEKYLSTSESFVCEDFLESVSNYREEAVAILKEKINIGLDNDKRTKCLEGLLCLEGSSVLTQDLIYEKDILIFKPTFKTIIFSQNDFALKKEIITFLGEIGNEDAVGYLSELYYTVYDLALKKEIIFALRNHSLKIIDAEIILEISKAYPEITKKDQLTGKELVDDYFQEIHGTAQPYHEEEKEPGTIITTISIVLAIVGFFTLLPILQLIGILILKRARKRNENSKTIRTAFLINLISILGVAPISLMIIVLLVVGGITWFQELFNIIGVFLI